MANQLQRNNIGVIQTLVGQTDNSTYDMLLCFNCDQFGDIVSKTVVFTDVTDIQNALIVAKSASEAKTEFLSRVSHEIRTPMNAIIGMAKIAKDSGDVEKKEYCIGRISEASVHLLALINDILDMSKIEANKFELGQELFNLDEMLMAVRDIIVDKANEKKLRLSFYRDPDLPDYLEGDRMRLVQIITNLLSNAVKFTPENGSVTLSVKLEEELGDGIVSVYISVEDTGIGIAEENLDKLFQPFEQAEKNTAVKYGGTGLGLAIFKRIAEMMGGNVGVSSEVGKGSIFYCNVKMKRSHSKGDQEIVDVEVCTFSKCRLLLAEDIDINREIALELLKPTLISIDCAVNGQEAFDMFSKEGGGYDIVLMDIQMPMMNGLQATRMIRESGVPNSVEVPILAMTANAFAESIEECFAAGMNDHVSKPIDAGELIGKMGKHLLGKAD